MVGRSPRHIDEVLDPAIGLANLHQFKSFFRMCFANVSLISRWRGTACATRVWADGKLSHAPHSGNCAAREILPKILQLHLQIRDGVALRQVVRELLRVAQPVRAVLPVNVSSTHNVLSLRPKPAASRG